VALHWQCPHPHLLNNDGATAGDIMNILRIDSSTNGANSVSRTLTQAIVAHLTASHEAASVWERDLAAQPIPHLDPAHAQANRSSEIGGLDEDVLAQFLEADVIVIGAPMYNFAVPSQLKAWIDRLAVPRRTFRYGESGVEGLAGGRKIIIASARGGTYGDDSPMDFQESYLKAFFGFIGIDDVAVIRAEGIGLGEEARAKAIADAKEAIASL